MTAPSYVRTVPRVEVTARVAVEAASTFGWERYVGGSGEIIGMRTFGASAPLKDLERKFGFEPDHVVRAAREQIARGGQLATKRANGAQGASLPKRG